MVSGQLKRGTLNDRFFVRASPADRLQCGFGALYLSEGSIVSEEKPVYLKAIAGEKVERTPIWLMRQAGRYLPEYRALRAKAGDFMTLCSTFDAAILFSDILTIPDAMGLGLGFEAGEGPVFERSVRDRAAIDKLGVPDPEAELRYVMDAVRLIRSELAGRVPLIGFAGSPWTLAVYMVEGRSTRDFNEIKRLIYTDPIAAEKLLDLLAESVSIYLDAQVVAGAQSLMIFDTWGGVLTARDYDRFSLRWMNRIVEHLKKNHSAVPVTLFTKGGGQWLEQIANSGCNMVGLDWTTSIADARARVGDRVALQGNMDPALLETTPERACEEARQILRDFGSGSGHVFNLGHGIRPTADPEIVAAVVEAVHGYRSP